MATEAPPRSRIVYSTLPDPAKYIRLLNVEADSTNAPRSDRIRISILTTLFDHSLVYHAVSYAWGSSLEEEDITLGTGDEEEHMTVRRNCADVLRQLAHFKTTKYYWVDAICINQSDQHEKGFQVDMMGSIYRQAECVLACIGLPHGDGQSLTHWLRGSPTASFHRGIHDGSDQEMERDLRLCKQWLDGIPAAQIVPFAKALDEVAKLPYFTRVWILQELFLARSLKIFYGFDELSLSTLLFWWQQLKPDLSTQVREQYSPLLYKKLCLTGDGLGYIEKMRRNDPEFFTEEGGFRLGKAYEDLLLKCVLSTATKINAPKDPIRLSVILDLCKNKLCKDPRDKVYGTLALADWREATTLTLDGDILKVTDGVLKADYTKTPFDLAKELLPYFNDIDQMLQILEMLKILQADISISDDTVRRWHVSSSIQMEYDEYFLSMAKLSTQKHVHIAGGCVQLTRKGPFRLRYLLGSSGAYVGIIDSNASLCGVATAGVHTDDWIFPTYCGYGIVIRQINARSMFYTIVGRVACLPHAISDDFRVTAFLFCLGVEDVVIHLMHSVDAQDDWSDSEGPSEALQNALKLPFCSEPFSSFAVLLVDKHTHIEEDFKDKRESEKITWELMMRWRYTLIKLRGYCEDSSLDSSPPAVGGYINAHSASV
jgi:hypothetical protein